jgi:hypothetical protein
MGYTHYWYRNEAGYTDADLFTAYFVFADMAKQIFETAKRQGILLADKYGETLNGETVDNGEVSFNGYADDAHETFAWYRECPPAQPYMKDSRYFDCCKTARKPYDAVVTAMLLAVKEAYGDAVTLESDGLPSEWEDGERLFEEATGNYATVKFGPPISV